MSALNISSFIWGIADDVLRDVYVRGKYRDVILPMTVIRRLDAVLEPTKDEVRATKERLDAAGITNQEVALRQASGEAFYNTSPFRLRDLTSISQQQRLRADFEAYLDGFSPNIQEVLEKFEFRNQIPRLVDTGALGFLLEKFLDRSINLSPHPVLNADGSVRLEGLDNHGMGTVFEELIRRFNEEAGEHFTPRDVVQLMARLVFLPVADEIRSGTYLVYDGACGTGGMLTVAEETLTQLAAEQGKEVSIHLYGQEVNSETYAISKADLILKGEGVEADNMQFGSTLSADSFPAHEFDFMLSNPPYGKSWKTDLERMGGKSDIMDSRFVVEHGGDADYSLITRSSDGQMMFLANMLSKMKQDTPLGSRIAEVHNGSSLFTGDAGQGESNIRRICDAFLAFEKTEQSKIFPNEAFGYWKVTVEHPLRLTVDLSPEHRQRFRAACRDAKEEPLSNVIDRVATVLGAGPHPDFNRFMEVVVTDASAHGVKLTAKRKNLLQMGLASREEASAPVIKKTHKPGSVEPDPIRGLIETTVDGQSTVVEYEPDTALRDTEQVPLLHEGGIEAFIRREVLPYAPDAWYGTASVKVGYEISFTRHFYKPQPLRPLEEIRTDILALERETEGLLAEIVSVGK